MVSPQKYIFHIKTCSLRVDLKKKHEDFDVMALNSDIFIMERDKNVIKRLNKVEPLATMTPSD